MQKNIKTKKQHNRSTHNEVITESSIQTSVGNRKLTVAYQHNHVDRPMIRMAGLWLREAGFQIGDPIQVDITNTGLRIRNMQNDPSE